MTKENFALYAQLKKQEKAVEEELKRLQPLLIAEMEEAKADKVDSEQGTFTLSAKKKWSYSEAVDRIEANLKEVKKTEQATGTAKYEESKYLVFRDPVPSGHVAAVGARVEAEA